MHNVSMCVSVLQIKYQCIEVLMYHCVLINKVFSAIDIRKFQNDIFVEEIPCTVW